MKNLDASIANQSILDESVSNFTAKDLLSKEAIRAGLLSGTGVFGAAFEANRQDKLKAKAEAAALAAQNAQTSAEKEIAQAELEAANKALAEAQAQLQSQGSNTQMKTGDEKKFPWLLVGGITFGVLALGVTAYFVFRKK